MRAVLNFCKSVAFPPAPCLMPEKIYIDFTERELFSEGDFRIVGTMIFSIVAQIACFAGALCLLLFGMNMLSDGIQKGAGGSLRKLLSKITGNRFYAVLTGLGVTAFIQSSGATTVMVVSFVNAEILTLEQAVGVIFGANIGTTVTAWIVALLGFGFSVSAAAVPLFGLGFVLKYFRKSRIHNFADCFMGFALLFMGLGLLKESLSLGGVTAGILSAISGLGIRGILIGVLLGALVTALIHSSSAMTAIVLTMAANGSLSWELGAAIVLGSNIGSTVDAVMSSFGASTNAKRAALVHVGFNVAGTFLALLAFGLFLRFVDFIVPGLPSENITAHIAMLHTVFNVCATLAFLPFVNQISAATRKIIPEQAGEDDGHYRLPSIITSARTGGDLYSVQVNREISRMASKVMEMFDSACTVFRNPSAIDGECASVARIESYVDEMNVVISDFLQYCARLPSSSADDRRNFTRLMNISGTLEDLSDETCSLMHTARKFIKSGCCSPSDARVDDICDYLELVRVFFEQTCSFFAVGISDDQKASGEVLERKIDRTKHRLKKSSRKRIEAGADVKSELHYIDIVRKIERAGDCVWSMMREL